MDNVTTEMIDKMEPDQLAELPPGVLADLHWMLAQDTLVLKQREVRLHSAFEHRWGGKASEARLQAGKDTGSVHVMDGEYDVCVTAPKRVKWDQAKLKAVLDQMSEETARHYAKVSIAIEERKFEAAPPDIRALLIDARTVETGKTVFALSPLKEEVA